MSITIEEQGEILRDYDAIITQKEESVFCAIDNKMEPFLISYLREEADNWRNLRDEKIAEWRREEREGDLATDNQMETIIRNFKLGDEMSLDAAKALAKADFEDLEALVGNTLAAEIYWKAGMTLAGFKADEHQDISDFIFLACDGKNPEECAQYYKFNAANH